PPGAQCGNAPLPSLTGLPPDARTTQPAVLAGRSPAWNASCLSSGDHSAEFRCGMDATVRGVPPSAEIVHRTPDAETYAIELPSWDHTGCPPPAVSRRSTPESVSRTCVV